LRKNIEQKNIISRSLYFVTTFPQLILIFSKNRMDIKRKTYSRREAIRLLALSGLSIYVLSCSTDIKPTDSKKKIPDPELVKVPETTELEDILASNDVVFIDVNNPKYDSLKQGFNKGITLSPALIALCKNTEGVAQAIKYANIKKLKVTVKSGGHSFEGFSTNEGGLVINLSLMNTIDLVEETKVKVGPAALLHELNDFLLHKNRILPAGSCGTVAIGGLTLGGGYGLFARKFGLTCDHLEALTLVGGNGNVYQAKNDDELLWACKGGGNGNFGVVTSMTFKTHKTPSFFQQYRFKAFNLDLERAKLIMETWFKLSKSLPDSCFSAFILNHKTIVILITNFESCKCESLSDMLTALGKLMDKTSLGKKQKLARSIKRYYGRSGPLYFKNSSGGFYDGFSDISGCVDDIINVVLSTPGMLYQINTLGGKIDSAEFENASAYPHRSKPYLSEIQTYWERPKKGERLMKSFSKVLNIIEEHGIDSHYRNYPCKEINDWETKYYGKANYSKLQSIKFKYDPNDVIQHPQSINLESK
jgi:hypothetical protein